MIIKNILLIEIELTPVENKYGKFISILIIEHQIELFSFLFAYSESIKSIKFTQFNRNNIIDMSEMFSRCFDVQQ